jgi:hypothetical protein
VPLGRSEPRTAGGRRPGMSVIGNTVLRVRTTIRAAAAVASLLAVLCLGPLGLAPAHAASTLPGPIVLLGTGGLRWSDVDSDTPALFSLQSDSVGWLVVRSVRSTTCPVDGWLSVSAGRRAADTPTPAHTGCRAPSVEIPTPGQQGTVPAWPSYVDQANADTYEATPGLFGTTLITAGRRTAAVGPGAAIALADAQGRTPHAWAGGITTEKLADDVEAALATNPQLLAVDLGEIRDPTQQPSGSRPLTSGFAQSREDQVKALDSRLGLILGRLNQLPNATVLVASLADAGSEPQLQLVAARGPAPLGGSYGDSLLGSRSTRQDAIVQSTDLMPTLLKSLGVPAPPDTVGSPLQVVERGSEAHRLGKLDDVDLASAAIRPIVPWFFNGLVIAQIVLYGLATLVLRRLRGEAPAAAHQRQRTLRWLRQCAVVFAAVPAATFLANLVPWWRAGTPGLAVTLAVIGFVVPIALLALLGPWRRTLLGPMGTVGAVTMLVLGIDALTGSHLVLLSLMGLQPVVAGRFYGFGNPAFSLFATGALLLGISVADVLVRQGRRKPAAAAVALIGVVATIIDGTPGFGSDFGGPPAIIPAFAVLALFALGVRVTWRRALLIAAVTLTVILLLSVIDWLRPEDNRTHLGRFVQTVIDGGAWPVVQRKAEQNIHILFTSWLSALLPFAVAFVVLVLARPVAWGVRPLQLAYDRSPMLRHGLIAFGVLMLLGAGLNDSGAVVPAVAATVALPLLISASVRALELKDDDRLAAAIEAARKPKRSRQ